MTTTTSRSMYTAVDEKVKVCRNEILVSATSCRLAQANRDHKSGIILTSSINFLASVDNALRCANTFTEAWNCLVGNERCLIGWVGMSHAVGLGSIVSLLIRRLGSGLGGLTSVRDVDRANILVVVWETSGLVIEWRDGRCTGSTIRICLASERK